jgi:hypothetical protein
VHLAGPPLFVALFPKVHAGRADQRRRSNGKQDRRPVCADPPTEKR